MRPDAVTELLASRLGGDRQVLVISGKRYVPETAAREAISFAYDRGLTAHVRKAMGWPGGEDAP
jgi:hypothetical protein